MTDSNNRNPSLSRYNEAWDQGKERTLRSRSNSLTEDGNTQPPSRSCDETLSNINLSFSSSYSNPSDLPLPLTEMTKGFQSSLPSTKENILPCKFYLLGSCMAGKNCKYLHIKHHENPKLICSYYLKGYCKFGDRCALEHLKLNTNKNTTSLPYDGKLKRRSSDQDMSSTGNPSMDEGMLNSSNSYASTTTHQKPQLLENYFGNIDSSPKTVQNESTDFISRSKNGIIKNQDIHWGDNDAPQSVSAYDKSLFEDNDNDASILNIANEWMKEASKEENETDINAFSTSMLLPSVNGMLHLSERSESSCASALSNLSEEFSELKLKVNEGPLLTKDTNFPSIQTYNDPSDKFGLRELFDSNDYTKHHRHTHSAPFSSSPVSNNSNYNPTIPFIPQSLYMQENVFPYSDIVKSNSNTNENLLLTPPGVASVSFDESDSELCVFAKTNTCRYGSKCRYLHGDLCQFCHLYTLHPSNAEKRNDHLRTCEIQSMINDKNFAISEQDLMECGICYEKVTSKPDSRFGLLNCEHPFCLECIRSWRGNQSLDPSVVRSCPICRVLTYVITPSVFWPRDATEKAHVLEEYRQKLKSIPCKYFKQGEAACPFGSSCFYAHLGKDGKQIEPGKLRTYIGNDEEVKVVSEIRLSDFLTASSVI